MPKCTPICIFRVWALLVRSLFGNLLLEGVCHAFCRFGSQVRPRAPQRLTFDCFLELFERMDFEHILVYIL